MAIGFMGAGVLGFNTSAKPRSIGTARPSAARPILGTAKFSSPLARLDRAATKVDPMSLALVSPIHAIAAQQDRVIVDAPELGPKVRGGGSGLPGSSSGSANDAINPAPQPSAIHPGLDPASNVSTGSGPGSGGGFSGGAFGGGGGEGATDPSGDTPAHGSTFGVSATFPTWALVAGGVVFAGLAVFALHRVLPAKRGGSKKAA